MYLISRRFMLRSLVRVTFVLVISTGRLIAQVCPPPPASPSPSDFEQTADDAFVNALVDSGGCMAVGENGCARYTLSLNRLRTEALAASSSAGLCAATGTTDGGNPLQESQKSEYLARAAFWYGLFQSLQQETASVSGLVLLGITFCRARKSLHVRHERPSWRSRRCCSSPTTARRHPACRCPRRPRRWPGRDPLQRPG